jgi:hypothetical protein
LRCRDEATGRGSSRSPVGHDRGLEDSPRRTRGERCALDSRPACETPVCCAPVTRLRVPIDGTARVRFTPAPCRAGAPLASWHRGGSQAGASPRLPRPTAVAEIECRRSHTAPRAVPIIHCRPFVPTEGRPWSPRHRRQRSPASAPRLSHPIEGRSSHPPRRWLDLGGGALLPFV